MANATPFNIPERGLEQWAPIVIDYLYQLVGDAPAVEELAGSVLIGGPLSDLSLAPEKAFLRLLTDATDAACNYLQPRGESDHLKPLLHLAIESQARDREALDSIVRAARHLPVLKRAALALSDQMGLSDEQIGRVLRHPPDFAAKFVETARREYVRELTEITRMRGQVPLADIAPAMALGLRARRGYASSAFALVPFFELPSERLSLIFWDSMGRNGERRPAGRGFLQNTAVRVAAMALLFVLVSLGGGWLAYNAWLGTRPASPPMPPSATPINSPVPPTATLVGIAATPVPPAASRTPAPTSTVAPIATPIPTTTPTPSPTATLLSVDTATATTTATLTPTPTATGVPPTSTSAPTATSAPAIVEPANTATATRRPATPRPTATPTTRYYYVPPTRTPTRPPTATPTFRPHTPTPTVFHPTITPTP